MAWIEVHQSLISHRKTLHAADLLGLRPVHLVGHLVALWLWALDNVPDGNLDGTSPRIIAYAAQWDDDPAMFVTALVQSGFLTRDDNGDLLIHDWYDYAGKLLDRRQANTARMRAARAIRAHNTEPERATHVQDTTATRAPATVPNPTVPNPTVHESGAKRAAPAVAPTPIVAKPATPSQALFSTLAEQCGYSLGKLTASERGEINAATKQLLAAHYDPVDIAVMAANWCSHFDDCSMTPSAIAKHASRLMKPAEDRRNGRRQAADIDVTQSKYAAVSRATVPDV